jgi:hypothetical protein
VRPREQRPRASRPADGRTRHRGKVTSTRWPWRWRLPFGTERVPEGMLVLIVVGSVLAIGTVHPLPLVVLASLCVLGLGLALWERRGELHAYPLLAPAMVLGALALYTALQLVPLPIGLLETIAPANADVWTRVALPLGEPAPTASTVNHAIVRTSAS